LLLFVDDGDKMTVKQTMNLAGFSAGDCKIEKHRSTISRRKRKLVEQQSKRKNYHLHRSFTNSFSCRYSTVSGL